MNRFLTLARAALLSLALALPIVSGSAHAEDGAQTAATKHYVCPACAAPCDTLVFDAPGTCPQCGMALVEQAAAVKAAAEQPPAKKVAILVFNNVEIIDFSGPYEMFGTAGYDVYTVAATKDPVTTAMGLKLIPQYSFADAPAPDVLLVPGGGVKGACSSAPTLAWVREASAHSQHTLSVCNGAFILGQAGLLDGLTATTTAAGLSSGIDGALHVLSVMEGSGAAQQVALSQEYDWNPTSSYARAALADMVIPNVNMDDFGHWTVVRTEGDRERWDMEMRGTSTFSANELLAKLGDQLASGGKWAKAGGNGTASRWSIAGADGRKWTGTLTLAPTPGAAKAYTVHLTIARAS